jgi:ribonuclease-3
MSRVVRVKDLDLAELERTLGVGFLDRGLLEQALTHVSAAKGARIRLDSYQRLEFLGDRVLGLAVSDMLYRTFPDAEEGDLSRRLAELVRRESCAEVAIDWNLGRFLRLGAGEAQSGGRKKTAILADICEAVIGAVFLDQGFAAATGCVERAWSGRMLKPHRPLRDAKTVLQEWAQARGLPAPLYREIGRSGPDHAPDFEISAEVQTLSPALGRGPSKRLAEQAAAVVFLRREGVWALNENGAES